ncbi:hypothetical protein M3X99_15130 (plasmid) [Clostridium perfringens]|uniref:hypothetical protein n=1 Tax=Clostridium perfringens TaxID=1502 RepID=UPI0023413DB5|nr:hypothetical protein [Clostridium perfringens]MDC4252315.1 hypothetical protein [Clostridium perfringens]
MDLEKNYFNKKVPIPNYVIDSGRRMYLIWLINTVPSKALPLWKAIQDYLYKQLKDFGADRQALDDVLELNSMFRQTLRENEVIKATRSAEKCYLDNYKLYKYKNDTLIELLEINEEEQRNMKIIISKEEYKRRKRIEFLNKFQRCPPGTLLVNINQVI